MKHFKLVFVLVVFTALLFNAAFTLAEVEEEDEYPIETETLDGSFGHGETEERDPSMRGMSRFLAQKIPINATDCGKYPKICRRKGSPGKNCCKSKCVDLKKDKLNCGECGKKCKFTSMCCKGHCVNQSFDRRNCGECGKKCKKGDYCEYGICSYA
ncbi:hypothetical protein ACHQM5_014819 [Ranunculus cassubicifolius]